jgi:hypothetical protein
MSKKDRDEAINRAGQSLFGESWIGELAKSEWERGRHHIDGDHSRGRPLPSSAKEAVRAARAALRCSISAFQYGQVFRWLESEGIDTAPAAFNRAGFERWFSKKFGSGDNTASGRRRASVRKLLKTLSPGRGGRDRWKTFCDAVRKDCDRAFDDKTIKRDVKEIRGTA